MRVENCLNCNSDMLENTTNAHYELILGQRTLICEVEGVKCLKCNHMHYDDEAKNYIKQNIQVKKTERMQDSDYVPILINHTKKIRLNTKLSQKMIGNALGVTEQRYGTIERNSNTPTVVTEHQIAEILGVTTDDLYSLIYINKSFYNDLKDMELYYENNKPMFKVVEEVKEGRKALFEIREKIQVINDEIRTLRNKLNKGNLTPDEYELSTKGLRKEREVLKTKKGSTNTGIEGRLKKIEAKYNLIVKQENVVDSEEWDLVKEEFKNELKEWTY